MHGRIAASIIILLMILSIVIFCAGYTENIEAKKIVRKKAVLTLGAVSRRFGSIDTTACRKSRNYHFLYMGSAFKCLLSLKGAL